MNATVKLAVFGAGLVALFGAAVGIGAAVGGPDTTPAAHEGGHSTSGAAGLPGLSDAQDGYSVGEIAAPTAPNTRGTLEFSILRDGKPVTAFDTVHDKQLHLIVVRNDTTQFRHVHPELKDGVWSIDWTWPTGGSYRVYTDFTPTGGKNLTLAKNVTVSGDAATQPLPAPSRVAEVDGYRVELGGDLRTGGGPLTFTVSRDGAPITDLDPYLGAYGHLVALRAKDLAYLHVHPESEVPGPQVSFHAEAPSTGQYRLFLDFKHAGVVRTAEFTVDGISAEAAAGHGGHGAAPTSNTAPTSSTPAPGEPATTPSAPADGHGGH